MNVLILLAEAGDGGTVQQIARTFGVDWPHLIAQTISFCIVCALLYRFAYRRVLSMLEERQKLIAQGLAAAEESKAELSRTEVQRRETMTQAHARVNELIRQAHDAAARVRERETQNAIAEAEALIVNARDSANREYTRMLDELKHEVGQLVVQTTEKIAGKVLTPEDKQRLAQEAIMHVDAP